jgi:hypothetical protein
VPEPTDTLESVVNSMFTDTAAPASAEAAPTADAPQQEAANAPAEPATQEVIEDGQATETLSLEDQLKQYGINDPAELEVWKQDREQKAELERELEFMRMQAKIAQYQTQNPAAPTPAEQAVDPLQEFSPPDYDPSWDARYAEGRNEDGTIKWKADAPVEVRLKREAHDAFRAQFAEKFVADPRKNFIEPLLEQAKAQARQEALAVFREEQQAMQTQQVIDKALSDNADWIYAKGRDGKPISGPDGQPVWSEAGKRWEAFYMDAKSAGVSSDAKALEYATKMYRAEFGEPKQQQIKAQIQQNRVQAQLSPANHVPQRNGQQLPYDKAPSLTADDPDAWEKQFLADLGITH